MERRVSRCATILARSVLEVFIVIVDFQNSFCFCLVSEEKLVRMSLMQYFFYICIFAEVCRGWVDHDERFYNVPNVDGNGLDLYLRVAHVFVVVAVACVSYSNEATLLCCVYSDLGLQVQSTAMS